jgi:hypothetical protein
MTAYHDSTIVEQKTADYKCEKCQDWIPRGCRHLQFANGRTVTRWHVECARLAKLRAACLEREERRIHRIEPMTERCPSRVVPCGEAPGVGGQTDVETSESEFRSGGTGRALGGT